MSVQHCMRTCRCALNCTSFPLSDTSFPTHLPVLPLGSHLSQARYVSAAVAAALPSPNIPTTLMAGVRRAKVARANNDAEWGGDATGADGAGRGDEEADPCADDDCACRAHGRECDPELCVGCGARYVFFVSNSIFSFLVFVSGLIFRPLTRILIYVDFIFLSLISCTIAILTHYPFVQT